MPPPVWSRTHGQEIWKSQCTAVERKARRRGEERRGEALHWLWRRSTGDSTSQSAMVHSYCTLPDAPPSPFRCSMPLTRAQGRLSCEAAGTARDRAARSNELWTVHSQAVDGTSCGPPKNKLWTSEEQVVDTTGTACGDRGTSCGHHEATCGPEIGNVHSSALEGGC